MNDSVVNETVNFTQNNVGTSANEIILNLFSSSSGIPLGESVIFWLIVIIFGFILYTVFSMFTEYDKPVIVMISMIPLFAFDLIESFGTYTFDLPFLGIYEVDRFVMTLGLMDWIFGFQIFNPALEIMSNYPIEEGDPLTTALSFKVILDWIFTLSWIPISILFITAAVSIGDSILQFLIFFMAVYYAISIIEDRWERQFSLQLPVSIAVGLLPVLVYACFFSNPIHEFKEANIQIASVFNFISAAPLIDKGIVVTLGIISFVVVLLIFSVMTKFVLSSTIAAIPSRQQKKWTTDYSAVAFITTLLYAFLYVMHPDYKWYLIITVIIIWKIFRHVMEDIAHEAKGRTKEREMRRKELAMIVHEVQHPSYDERNHPGEPQGSNSVFFTIEIILAIIGFTAIFFAVLLLTGIL
ncbi:hypothetical protein KAU33_02410 [Candidatus Dependentiae bacterium]|nr:hypothetical protein [Candidatus Dependentiae bacterium]